MDFKKFAFKIVRVILLFDNDISIDKKSHENILIYEFLTFHVKL